MSAPLKQHLIDPEICIRCYSCEAACTVQAISHNDDNVVVDGTKCEFCMACIPVCPTGSIDEWRVVENYYPVEDQLIWLELPQQQDFSNDDEAAVGLDAIDDSIQALLDKAHEGAGGKAIAPQSASKPSINLFNLGNPLTAIVQGNFRLTDKDSNGDVRHIILDLGQTHFPVLEGQSIGIIPPGLDENGKPFLPRLYSVSSPRDGERPNYNNLSLTVKREPDGVCSNYLCDLEKDDEVKITGPFGSTFLLPNDPAAHVMMICTGTGSAPFRGFTMRRQREMPNVKNSLSLYFGARRPQDLPYFGPLNKMPKDFLKTEFAFSRLDGQTKEYVQDKIRTQKASISKLLQQPNTHIFICGLKEMENGVDEALSDVAREIGIDWAILRDEMRQDGRFHIETY